jgi:serine protease Do
MSNRSTTFFFALMIATASLVAGMVIASRLDLSPESLAQAVADTAVPAVASSDPVTGPLTATTFRDIAADVSPAVVNIRTESRQQAQDISGLFEGGGDLFERFFGGPVPEQPPDRVAVAAGTGFVIDQSGYILTNNHVVENAEKIEVSFFGEDADMLYEAEVVGRDPLTDSALIRLTETPAFELPVVRFGDSEAVQPGDWVMAIGNPFNLAHTVSVGVISALARPFPVAEGRSTQVLQTDAAINPGNSGGPLLNLRGEVIGINTAIYTDAMQSGNIGIGFAVPMNAVRELLPQLRAGRVSRGVIGVSIGPVPVDAIDEFGLAERMGALVRGVNRGGPAANAGIEPGDVIVSFDGQRVDDGDALVQMVLTTRPGDTVPVEVMRDRARQTLRLTVGELNLETEQQAAQGGLAPPQETTAGFGLGLGNVTPDAARQLELDPGTEGALVVSIEPQGAAARAGVAPGDVILEVNRQPVATAAAASRELGTVPSGGTAFLLVLRNGQETFITITRE